MTTGEKNLLEYAKAVEALRAQYDEDGWGEHPDYLIGDWREDVANGDTRRGYWDWVLYNIETHQED